MGLIGKLRCGCLVGCCVGRRVEFDLLIVQKIVDFTGDAHVLTITGVILITWNEGSSFTLASFWLKTF